MSVLSGKKILLGVTGGIAAYKIPLLVRLLIKAGAQVKVILSPEAEDFVTPLTLATLSKNPVITDFVKVEEGLWNNHVTYGKWADLMCIAPLTAQTLSKMVNGHADNFLMATYLSAACPVFIAPAMDLDMYTHPTTRENLKKAAQHKCRIIASTSGELASGLVGPGRMAEPEEIFRKMEDYFQSKASLQGKKIMITAGPTYEAIDPVRFIGNHSSGKMGYALAERAAEMGAEVYLISGPTSISVSSQNIKLTSVMSAQEMYEAAKKHFEKMDVVIAAAAVADYRPKQVAQEKIKKSDRSLTIELEKTTDILENLGRLKKNQLLVGFALETENEEANAKSKLKRKNLNFIVLNSLREEGAGFKGDTNKISIIKEEEIIRFDLKSKDEVARDILKEVVGMLKTKEKPN